MTHGILIQYRYSGDEAAWKAATGAFIGAIDRDPEVRGRFSYSVNVLGDGEGRVHVGRWDSEATLKTLQSRDYFKTFSANVEKFANGTLKATRFANAGETT
jgi:hypothetical protein